MGGMGLLEQVVLYAFFLKKKLWAVWGCWSRFFFMRARTFFYASETRLKNLLQQFPKKYERRECKENS